MHRWTAAVGRSVLVVAVAGGLGVSAAGAGRGLTAKVFMKGMAVPAPGWTVHEDHPGEFNILAPAGRMNGTTIHFWLDPYASGSKGVVLRSISRTPAGLISWLRHNKLLLVTAPKAARIGRLAARYVDVDLAPNAPAEDPSCPGPCQTWLEFKSANYDFPFGTGLGEITRTYFAALKAHTFVVAVDAPSPAKFAAAAPVAAKILAGVQLPSKVCASSC